MIDFSDDIPRSTRYEQMQAAIDAQNAKSAALSDTLSDYADVIDRQSVNIYNDDVFKSEIKLPKAYNLETQTEYTVIPDPAVGVLSKLHNIKKEDVTAEPAENDKYNRAEVLTSSQIMEKSGSKKPVIPMARRFDDEGRISRSVLDTSLDTGPDFE